MEMKLLIQRWLCAVAVTSCALHPPAHADIYKWEYVDPGNPASGKRASSTPVAVGVFAGPGANLGLQLPMAYLDGYDLRNATYHNGNLTTATLVGANLAGGAFLRTTMTGADLTGATIHGGNVGAAFSYNPGLTAAQLYSTASYASGDLTRVSLIGNDLSGWNFAGQKLFGGRFTQSNLSGADFTGADVRYAHLGYMPLRNNTVVTITEAQLASTASYQARELSGINLSKCNLTGWNFSGQNLTVANFEGATLTGAQFTGANVRHALLGSISGAQLQSTANYQNNDFFGFHFGGLDLNGFNFAGMNLNQTNFVGANINGADFTGATIRQASFSSPSLTEVQLVSTADYQAGDLLGIRLAGDMSGWSFDGINLTSAQLSGTFTNANFTNANLTGARMGGYFTDADFTGATIKNVYFAGNMFPAGISAAQLYATASYQQGDLGSIQFDFNTLTGWNFTNQSLIGARFSRARLGGANFSGAIVRDANFSETTTREGELYLQFQAQQLYTTASYQQHDLRGIELFGNNLAGWNFTGQNLSGGDLSQSNLTGCDFTGALIDGVSFHYSGLTAGQIQSTASYAQGNFRGVDFSTLSLNGVQFADMDFSDGAFRSTSFVNANLQDTNLTNADMLSASLTGANLRGADARGSFGLIPPAGALADNMIHSNGEVLGLDLTGAGRLIIRDHDGTFGLSSIPPLPVQVREQLSMDATSTLELRFEADAWDSTISFDAGIPITLGGTLELNFVGDVNLDSQIGRTFDLFDWTGVSPAGAFAISSAFVWDLSKLYTTGEVLFLAATGLPGDFNANSVVDAADYTVWRDGLGSSYTQAAYNVWRTHFGQTTGSGQAVNGIVPEPTTHTMLVVNLIVLCRCRRTDRSRRIRAIDVSPAPLLACRRARRT